MVSLRLSGDRQPFARRCFVLYLGWFFLLASIAYWPVFLGKVPVPAEISSGFPPWEGVSPPAAPMNHGEMGDVITQYYPWRLFLADAASHGTLPLWNHNILLGTPFLANCQTAVGYPFNWLCFLLPVPVAWGLLYLIRTVLAGTITALLVRDLTSSRSAGLISGTVFTFSGWVSGFQGRPNLDSSLWIPLLLLGIHRLRKNPSFPNLALVAFGFALPVLGGNPENALHVILVGCLFAAFRFFVSGQPKSDTAPSRRNYSLYFAAAALFGAGLAAVQILPTHEWLGQISRGLNSYWGGRPLNEILTFFCRDLGRNLNPLAIAIPEGAGYAGAVTLLLAVFAFWNRRRSDAAFFGLLILACLQVIYLCGPVSWIAFHVPVLKGIPNWRLLVVVDLSVAILAGLGFDWLRRQWELKEPAAIPKFLAPVAVVWLVIIAFAGGAVALSARDGVLGGPFTASPLCFLLLLLLGAGAVALAWSRAIGPKVARRLIILLVTVDLLSFSYGHTPFFTPAEIFPPAPMWTFLQQQSPAGLWRVAAFNVTYGSNFEMAYQIRAAGGYDFPLLRSERLLSRFTGPASSSFDSQRLASVPNGLLALTGLRFLISTTVNHSAASLAADPRFKRVFTYYSVQVYENPLAGPGAFAVPAGNAEVLADDNAQYRRVTAVDFDPTRQVVLSERLPSSHSGQSTGGAKVLRVLGAFNDISVTAEAAEPAVLVVSSAWYPGWRASIDGRDVPVLRADYGFLAVALPPGRHSVLFSFRPSSVYWGAALSALSALAMVLLCLFAPRPSSPR